MSIGDNSGRREPTRSTRSVAHRAHCTSSVHPPSRRRNLAMHSGHVVALVLAIAATTGTSYAGPQKPKKVKPTTTSAASKKVAGGKAQPSPTPIPPPPAPAAEPAPAPTLTPAPALAPDPVATPAAAPAPAA